MKIITLDPGKGGNQLGAVYNSLIEKDINLSIVLNCRETLLKHGIVVNMTRDSDTYLGLSERIVKANNNNSDAFISIHCNEGGGAESNIIYSINEDKGFDLACKISSELSICGQNAIKIYNHMGHGNNDFNTVIREAQMVSVIVYCAFLDNDIDNKLVYTNEKQRILGNAIAKGILNYFQIDTIYK